MALDRDQLARLGAAQAEATGLISRPCLVALFGRGVTDGIAATLSPQQVPG